MDLWDKCGVVGINVDLLGINVDLWDKCEGNCAFVGIIVKVIVNLWGKPCSWRTCVSCVLCTRVDVCLVCSVHVFVCSVHVLTCVLCVLHTCIVARRPVPSAPSAIPHSHSAHRSGSASSHSQSRVGHSNSNSNRRTSALRLAGVAISAEQRSAIRTLPFETPQVVPAGI